MPLSLFIADTRLPAVCLLLPVDPAVRSAYDRKGLTGGPREGLQVLGARADGRLVAEAGAALVALDAAVKAAGGDLRVSDCHRPLAVQAAARQRYDAWVAAGKPRPGSSRWNAATMKAAYVASPGWSNHNGGRAVDLDIAALRFPDVDPGRQLDRLWELARPLGWEPVIAAPEERASESWHFDFWGDLAPLRRRAGYGTAALVAALMVGHGPVFGVPRVALAQALLHRAGFDPGPIDGERGPRTLRALRDALPGAASLDLMADGILTALCRREAK